MRVVAVLLVLAAVVVPVPGCDSSGAGTVGQGGNALALLQGCTLARTLDLFAALEGLQNLLLAAQDPAAAVALGVVVGPSLDPADPPHTFTYHVPIDLDGDGQRDDAIDGKITFSKNPLLGFVPGDTADLSWTLVGDDAQGSGDFDLLLTPSSTVEITGGGTVTAGTCTMDFVTVGAHPLAVPLATLEVGGWIDTEIVAGADTLEATIKIEPMSDIVQVEDVLLNGVSEADFTLDLGTGGCQPPVAGLAAWVGRWRVDFDCVEDGTGDRFSGTFWVEISLVGNGLRIEEFEDAAFVTRSPRSPFTAAPVGGNPHRILYRDDNPAFVKDVIFELDPACGNRFSKTSDYHNKPQPPPAPPDPTSGTCTGTGARIGP